MIAALPTKVIETIASLAPSAFNAALAASFIRARETRRRRTLEETSIEMGKSWSGKCD
jgi:hypothetical protein